MKPKDVIGNYKLKVVTGESIPYRYFFKEKAGKIYRVSKLGDAEWREDLMPFNKIPYSVWKEEHQPY